MARMIIHSITVQGDLTRLGLSEPGTRNARTLTVRSLWFGNVPARFQLGDQIEPGEAASLWFPRGATEGISLEHVEL